MSETARLGAGMDLNIRRSVLGDRCARLQLWIDYEPFVDRREIGRSIPFRRRAWPMALGGNPRRLARTSALA